jgi:hypothetical protein
MIDRVAVLIRVAPGKLIHHAGNDERPPITPVAILLDCFSSPSYFRSMPHQARIVFQEDLDPI